MFTPGADDEAKNMEDPEECIVCGTKIKRIHCTYFCLTAASRQIVLTFENGYAVSGNAGKDYSGQ